MVVFGEVGGDCSRTMASLHGVMLSIDRVVLTLPGIVTGEVPIVFQVEVMLLRGVKDDVRIGGVRKRSW